MEKIPAENLFDEVTKLTSDQRILVDFPLEVCNRLELLGFQIQSAEGLHRSYINNTSEVANELNMDKFLRKYIDLAREKDTVFKDTVLKCLGTKVYDYLIDRSNKLFYHLDFNIKKLVIRKQGMS